MSATRGPSPTPRPARPPLAPLPEPAATRGQTRNRAGRRRPAGGRRSWLRVVGPVALLATVLVGVGSGSSPAAADGDEPDGYASFHFEQYNGGSDSGTLPDCGPININGRKNFAKWSVGSSVADGAEIEVGDTITLTATVFSRSPGSIPNDGPDPLTLKLPISGPAAPAAPTTGTIPSKGVYSGDDSVGPIGPIGLYGYRFDSDSNPNGLLEPGDGAYVQMTAKVKATAPGVITAPRFEVSGTDATPTASDFDCEIDLPFSWTVDDVDLPTSGADSATTDRRYGLDTVDDANGGAHGVSIDVLANDDDPEVAGGPGDPAEVRIVDWQPGSLKGGTVSCGTGAQKGTATFAQMSTGPCTYLPPATSTGNDAFTYILRSASGVQRPVQVNVFLRSNAAPTGGPAQFAANDEAVDVVFDLKPSAADVDGDALTCISDLPTVSNDAGDAFVGSDCTVTWSSNDTATQRTGTFAYRICDSHPLLTDHGTLADPLPGYDQGSPDDRTATTSSRCADAEASVLVTPINDVFIAPVVGVSDVSTVDAGYAADGIGAYSVDIPVFANDLDPNGPAPSDPTSGVRIPTTNGIQGVDPAAGTAVRLDARTIRFTPADGFSGPTKFTYVACEDPAQQTPAYPAVDDPNTPQLEGLPFCGTGTVALQVVGNDAPVAEPDEVLTAHDQPVTDLDVGVNDHDAQGETLECTPGALVAQPAGLVSSASIDAQCRVDLTPVPNADGVATLAYEVCDVHALTSPAWATTPTYGTDGRQPGDLANRCTAGELTATIVAPPAEVPDPDDADPAPVCAADAAATQVDQPIDVAVLANDTDEDLGGQPGPLTASSPGLEDDEGATTEGGTVDVTADASAVAYTPPAGFTGTDTFLYSAVDSVGRACSAEVTVTVSAADPDPTDPTNPGPTDPTAPGDVSGDGIGTGGSGTGGTGDGTLPRTGSDVTDQLALAAALLATGTALVATTRRRRTA